MRQHTHYRFMFVMPPCESRDARLVRPPDYQRAKHATHLSKNQEDQSFIFHILAHKFLISFAIYKIADPDIHGVEKHGILLVYCPSL